MDKKLEINIFHVYNCRNPQQNISKTNLTMHKENITPWLSATYTSYAGLVQYSIIR